MMTLQDLGLSILSDSPKSLYFIGGAEYGVKSKYIDKLTSLYGSKEEYPSMEAIISLFSTRHLLPLKRQLYVVRYDDNFITSLNDTLAKKIHKLNIIGTVVCLYEEDKHITKLDKYFPDNVGVVESVNYKFIEKYLHSDFPRLDDRSISIAAAIGVNYSRAKTICLSMSNADLGVLAKMSEEQLSTLFGCTTSSKDAQIRQAIAGRNFNMIVTLVDNYDGELDSIVYIFLQTMIDMEKVLTTKYSNSDIKDYAKWWDLEAVYYMFMHAYKQLEQLRSTSTCVYDAIVYLASLTTLSKIPSVEALNGV